MKTVVLVSCVGKKLTQAAPAQDLYRSAWFLKARRYAEMTGDAWYILSAKHGLVPPIQVIEPYEMTLPGGHERNRQTWAVGVLRRLENAEPPPRQIVMLAGKRYREPLCNLLYQAGYRVDVPMAGLGIGEQLAWLDEQANQQMSLFDNKEDTMKGISYFVISQMSGETLESCSSLAKAKQFANQGGFIGMNDKWYPRRYVQDETGRVVYSPTKQ